MEAARWDRTKSDYEMIVLQLAVKGFRSKLWYNVVCKCDTPEEQKRTDQWVGSVFAAFGKVPSPDVQVAPLVGCVGGVHVKNETRDGETRSRVGYLLRREKARTLSQGSAAKEPAADDGTADGQPQSWRNTPARTAGPKGAPGFDRYGEAYPPVENVRLDENDSFVPAGGEEVDIPF